MEGAGVGMGSSQWGPFTPAQAVRACGGGGAVAASGSAALGATGGNGSHRGCRPCPRSLGQAHGGPEKPPPPRPGGRRFGWGRKSQGTWRRRPADPRAEQVRGNPAGSADTSPCGEHLSEGAALGLGATGVLLSRPGTGRRARTEWEIEGQKGSQRRAPSPAPGAGKAGLWARVWWGEKAQPVPGSAPSGSTRAPLPRGPEGRAGAAPGGGDVHGGRAAPATGALSRPRLGAWQRGGQRRAAAERRQVGAARMLRGPGPGTFRAARALSLRSAWGRPRGPRFRVGGASGTDEALAGGCPH